MADPNPADWHRESEETVADARVFRVQRRQYRHGQSHQVGTFHVIDVADWAVVLAKSPEGNIVMVRQFRFGVEKQGWEMPAGLLNPGEDPVSGGIRELREETGFVGENARLLQSVHPNPALQNNRCHFIAVDNARRSDVTAWDQHEELTTSVVSLDELSDWIRAGAVTHALAVLGWHLLRDQA